MGRALLAGLLQALDQDSSADSSSLTVSRFLLCTKTKASAQSLQEELGPSTSRVEVFHANNKEAVEQADVVILGFKPYMVAEVLQASGMREALDGKLVISMLAGTDCQQIQTIISGSSDSKTTHIVRAIPSIAARYRQSITILEQAEPALPIEQSSMVERIFSLVGHFKWLPTHLVNVGTVLTTACLATLSIPLDGLLDGSVVEGLRRQDALELVVHGVAGLSSLLSNGTHPALMRESISSPRGCTIQTLMTAEKAGTRATFAQALIDGVQHLDKSKK
ncbi:hypothetical protein NM208_g8302 [Fusarium decemcellulare]|uniref:Uncharacterized protein n=2 Tax=Fusarium decemcellulare TaxID=57161 RepID=A0ACC1S5A5_9HYPO|nr:hypothetical protein NM208_g8480 [Fusarium decemcellulare]KAJ3532736.1 hypothetical protein NM208_g8302 [Fusarium decemcellulare]